MHRELTQNGVKISKYIYTGAAPGPERATRESRGDILIFLHTFCLRKVGRTSVHSMLLSRPLVNKTGEKETMGDRREKEETRDLLKHSDLPPIPH